MMDGSLKDAVEQYAKELWRLLEDGYSRRKSRRIMRQRYEKRGVKNIPEIEHAYQNATWEAD